MAAGGSKQAAVESKQGSLHGKVHNKVQKWREMRSARLLLLWYSVAYGRQQENSHRQVGSARASPLAFIAVALRWVARGKQKEKHSSASRVCQSQPHCFQPDHLSAPSLSDGRVKFHQPKTQKSHRPNIQTQRGSLSFAPMELDDRFSRLRESAVTPTKYIQSLKLNILKKGGRAGKKSVVNHR